MGTQGTRRRPPPRPRLHEGYPDTSPAAPTPTAPSPAGYPYTSAGDPRPARACGAPPPPPRRGRGPCVAISGEQPCPGWSWWEAVSGSSPGSPRALDRGDIATGGGADGEGELVPPPLSRTLQTPCFSLPASPTSPAPSLPAHRPPNRTCAPRAVSMCRRCCSLPLFHREQRHIRRLAGPREGEQILARQPGDHEPVALNPV